MIIFLVLLAILAFWMSTQQSAFLIRLPIWLAGAGLLVVAAYLALQAGGHGAIIAAVTDAWSNKDDPTEGVLFQALASNAPPTIQRYITPMQDLLIVFGLILGAFALLALTPGEFLERVFVRPLAIGILGAAVGASLALSIVAVALGGPVQLNRYVGYGAPYDPATPYTATQVYDGDTFSVGDVSVRLLDIDAPERGQTCLADGQSTIYKCGDEAQRELARIISDAVIDCVPRQNAKGVSQTSFNRTLVRCSVRRDTGGPVDIAEEMVRQGMAIPYDYGASATLPAATDYSEPQGVAQRQKRGLWRYCTLTPKVWRDEPGARERFKRNGTIPADPAKSIGDCSKQPKGA